MRVTRTINFKVTEDVEGRDVLTALDLEKATRAVDGMTHQIEKRVTINASATFVVDFTGIAAVRGFYVKAIDGDVNLVMNGAAPLQILRGSSQTGTPAEIGGEALLTSLSIVNPSSSAVLNVYYLIYGDPA